MARGTRDVGPRLLIVTCVECELSPSPFMASDTQDDRPWWESADDESHVPYVPLKKRRLDLMKKRKCGVQVSQDSEQSVSPPKPTQAPSLVQEARDLRERLRDTESRADARVEEERQILEAHTTRKKLAGYAEIAQNIQYTEPILRSWRPPHFVRSRTEEQNEIMRKRYHVSVEGQDPPPLISNFRDMKVPVCVIEHLRTKGIQAPTPIQMQGLPTAFSGRDMIGIAFTGGGKTLTFSLPLLLFSAEAESRVPFQHGDGPIGLIVCPSRELARQTYESIKGMAESLELGGYARVRALLCIGGVSMSEQSHILRHGVHMVVATPGRLQDMLEKKIVQLHSCTYLCLDEADRMMDMGFEDDVRNILSYFTQQRQTLLFSATMPKKILDLAAQSLFKPVVVHVGRAGAASLDIIQEVEYVDPEAKKGHLLETLQKTAPPVIIFSDNKNEVDDIHEFLLRKGVETVSIHGSKSQDEREYAVESFKARNKDVMVASGVASKGLDFHDVRHVINYTMPKDIEDYVHQIGRTGRSGRTGLASTFVNASTPQTTLLDLKYLLMEARQRVPSFFASLDDPHEGPAVTRTGCAVCGGLGHIVAHCPKLEEQQRRLTANMTRGEQSGY